MEFITKDPVKPQRCKDATELRLMVCPKSTSCIKYETIRPAAVPVEPDDRHMQYHMSCTTGKTTMVDQMFFSFSFAWLGHMATEKN
jgi:hypothetical protein